MFKRQKEEDTPAEFLGQTEMKRTRQRVARMSEREMLDWADTAGSGIYTAFKDYRRGETDALDDIRMGLVGMIAIYEELLALEKKKRSSYS